MENCNCWKLKFNVLSQSPASCGYASRDWAEGEGVSKSLLTTCWVSRSNICCAPPDSIDIDSPEILKLGRLSLGGTGVGALEKERMP